MEITNYVKFIIQNFDFHPNEITEKLGIKPTEILCKGEENVVGKSLRKMEFNRWSLQSSLDLKSSIDDHIQDLLGKLASKKDQIREYGSKYYTGINCGSTDYDHHFGLHLDKS